MYLRKWGKIEEKNDYLYKIVMKKKCRISSTVG